MTRSRMHWFLAGTIGALLLSCSAANADLVGLWRFDSQVDPQPDSSGLGNHATVVDATWIDDPTRGGVMQFEGEGDNNPSQWLEVEDSDSLSIEETGLTIAAWANFAQFESWNSIMGKTGANSLNKPSPYDLYTMNADNGILRFYAGSGDGDIAFADSLDPPELEEWVHIAVTMDEEGEVTHYLNGENNGDGFIDREIAILIDEDTPLFIGSRADGTTNMHGLLDDVAVFNHALSPEEITNLVNNDFSAYIGGGGVNSGDFNGNGELDVEDINLLIGQINAPAPTLDFDLNGDGIVNGDDLNTWILDLRGTWIGDANLDGEFNSGDFVSAFTAGKYENGEAAGWEEGDWNADGTFSSSDFVTAFSGGGYEMGPRVAPAAVPEPIGVVTLLLGIVGLMAARRKI